MALALYDRVKETTTVTGTGTATLLGATTGFQSFAVVGNANTTYYCIADQGGANWEVGIGTYTASGTTLARTTVLSSSNADSLVTFTAGVKDVFVTYPSSKGLWKDASGNAIGLGTPASGVVTNLTGTASININGTVGATTATTGAFTTLAYTGTLTGGTGVVAIGTNQIVKDATGNVGIGTSIPVTSLTVQAGSGNGIKAYDASTDTGGTWPCIESIGSRGDGNGSFGGRFGAGYRRNDGTAIATGTGLGYYAFGGQWGTGTTYNQTNFLYSASVLGVSEGSFTSATAMPTALVFSTGSTGTSLQSINTTYGTERMRITSAGNVGIGTSSPKVNLSLNGAVTTTGTANILRLYDDGAVSTSTTSNSCGFGFNVSTGQTSYTSGTGGLHVFYTSNTERMRIASNGIVTMSAYGAGAATFSASGVISSVSDETWKIKDGVPVDADSMLQKLKPGYWYYNDEKKEIFGTDRQLGFYAQNVNEAIGPEAAPPPEEGKPWGYYDRSVLAVTVMSLQKALATIEALTERLTALEAK